MAKYRGYARKTAPTGDASAGRPSQVEMREQPVVSTPFHNLFCKFSLDGTLTFVNQAYARYFQKTPEQLIGTNLLNLVPNAARETISQQLKDLQALTPEHPALTQEHEALAPDGSIRWHQWTNLAQFDDRGNIVELQAVGQDITEQKTIEQALQKSEQLLNAFFTQSLDGFFFAMFDEPIPWQAASDKESLLDYAFEHFRVTRVNQAFLDQYLATEADMLGWKPADFFAADEQAGRQILRQLFDNGHLHCETHERRTDGTPILIEGDYICFYDNSQRIIGHFGVQRDITDITAAVRELADREAKYRLLVDNQTDLIIKTDPNSCFLFASPSYCELFGKAANELLGQTFMPLVHTDDQAASQAAIQKLFIPPHTCYIEQREMTVHGWRWLAWSNRAVLNEQGEIEAIVGVGRDITERKLAELALQDSEERFRIAMDAAQVGTWDWNIQTGDIIWSKTLEELMGLQPGSFDGDFATVQSMIFSEDRERVIAAIQAAVEEDADYTVEFRFVRPDGSLRWALGKGEVIRDADGNPLRMAGVDIDITERKQTELRLQESEARFRNVTTNLPGAVFRYVLCADGHDHITFMNQGCLDIWEVEPFQVADSPALLWEVIHPDDRATVWSLVQQSAVSLTPWSCEWRITTPSGKLKWLQGMGRPERLPNGDVMWDTLILDVSDRKKAELALTQTSQQLQSFLDNTPAMVALFDAEGHYLNVNQAGAELLGGKPEDFVGRAFADILPADTVETFMARTAELVAHQKPMVVEDRLSIQGQERVLQTILFPVTTEDDSPIVLGSVATDISPLVRAQTVLRRQADEERLIRTMTQHIRESLDLRQILQTTVTEVREFLNADRVLVYRFHGDWSGDMFVESVVPPWASVVGTTIHDPCFEGDLVTQYLEGRISQIEDIEQADIAPCHKALLGRFQVRANLIIPINCRGQLWGLLCVHHCQSPRIWQEDEIRLLRQMSDQVAIALYQSLLLSQSKARAAQEKLLNEIVTAISDSLELDQLLQRAASEMLTTFQVSRSLVILCQPTDTSLTHTTTAAVAGIDSLQGQTVPIRGNPHAQKVLTQEAPVVVTDVSTDPLMETVRELAQDMHIGAILAVAIRYKGRVKGILSVHQCHHPRHWSLEDQKLIKRIADHLAIAIQQAELYQQAQVELAERKRLEAQLRFEAFHDRLTTLPNRAFFLEQLSHALAQLRCHCREVSRRSCSLVNPEQNQEGQYPYQFAVLFLDLDRFKIINDSLGHNIGDTLLQIVAQRLQACLPSHHMAARLGGDEFVVLLTGLTDVSEATAFAQTIHNALEAPILLQHHEVFVGASIGIALSSPEYTDPSQILRDADIAMYQAKGGNWEYAIFDAPMHTLAVQQMQLENDLRHAIDRQEFELHYQPIVALDSGHLQGFEALIRWRHPHRGLVSPVDFIPVAENTGLIADIDLWTLNQACRQLHEWHHQFPQHRGLTVNVNLSGRQFVRADLIEKIDRALAETGLQGQFLKLEITESVLIQNANLAIDILNQLKQRHISICMDDFGTGYSSLSYLHRFPVDALKIDKSFISSLHTEDGSLSDGEIVRAIISLANSLNLAVVAEGIETLEQLNYLKANHCRGGQGYYYAKPMAAPDAAAYLQAKPSMHLSSR
jgi:diguanylate cyclase (GGDEF)-like protein/PAS domain S-box-containing protein